MSRCQISTIKNNDTTEFIFSDRLDESLSDHFDLFLPTQPAITIQLEAVSAINSVGIRAWVILMSSFGSRKSSGKVG